MLLVEVSAGQTPLRQARSPVLAQLVIVVTYSELQIPAEAQNALNEN